MNVDFSPKRQFQTNDKLRKELSVIVGSDNFHQALSAALSEFVYRHSPSAEQTVAIRNFINTLLLLSSEDQPMPAFPTKNLDHTVYTRSSQPPQTTKGHHD